MRLKKLQLSGQRFSLNFRPTLHNIGPRYYYYTKYISCSMDKQIDASFDRMDKALATLTDSIAKYNPGSTHGVELMAAEVNLSTGLQELELHQQNHMRIEELQAASKSLDDQIKDTLVQLAQARKELKQTPATVFPAGPNYRIIYDELLNYARRISKNTIPPSNVLNSFVAPESQAPPASGAETAATTPGDTPNGTISTPQQDPTTAAAAANPQQQTQLTVAGGAAPTATTATTGGPNLPEHLNDILNPQSKAEFVPWPSEDKIRQGSLAMLQYLREQGIEPEGYDPAEEELRKKREEDEARAREERERLEREEAERRAREERAARAQAAQEAAAARNAAGSSGATVGPLSASPIGEKKQFQFMDEDDDESE